MHRFFAPAFDPGDEAVTLPKDEAEHLTRVLRLGIGDTVSVFDGRGHEFLAKVATAARRDVRVQLLSRVEPAAERTVAVTLAPAVLKADKMDDVVRDAVMLGVMAVQPVVTPRTETTVAALGTRGKPDRWRRIALSSVKQSRRAVLPDVRTPLTLENYLGDPLPSTIIMLAEPGSAGTVEPIGVLSKEPVPSEAVVLIGPEGGWTEGEVALARSRGARQLSLGSLTLRADAVPIAALSVLYFLWEERS